MARVSVLPDVVDMVVISDCVRASIDATALVVTTGSVKADVTGRFSPVGIEDVPPKPSSSTVVSVVREGSGELPNSELKANLMQEDEELNTTSMSLQVRSDER